MMNTYDVRRGMSNTDVILDSLNRFYDAKLSGGLKENELSNIMIPTGDVFANKVKQGKVNDETIESYKLLLSQFIGKNKDKYFSFPHKDLDVATKTNYESIDFAKDESEKKQSYAMPYEGADSYAKGFRRLG